MDGLSYGNGYFIYDPAIYFLVFVIIAAEIFKIDNKANKYKIILNSGSYLKIKNRKIYSNAYCSINI